MRSIKIWLLVMAVAIAQVIMAQDSKGMISGIVKDARTKKPLFEAVITISSIALSGQKIALTDSTGMYRHANLPAATYSMIFEMEGYRTFTQDVALKEGQLLGVSLEMVRSGKEVFVKPKALK